MAKNRFSNLLLNALNNAIEHNCVDLLLIFKNLWKSPIFTTLRGFDETFGFWQKLESSEQTWLTNNANMMKATVFAYFFPCFCLLAQFQDASCRASGLARSSPIFFFPKDKMLLL